MSLSKAQLWALAGAGLGGLTALPKLFTKDKENRKKALKSFLLRAGLAGGSAYLLNKGLSNYIANSLIKNPYMYDVDKVKLLKPNWHLGRKEAIKDIVKRTLTTPNFDTVISYNGDPTKWARGELLARHLGVFDPTKGSIYYKMPDFQKDMFLEQFANAKDILNKKDIYTLDHSRALSKNLSDVMLSSNFKNKSGLNSENKFSSKGSVYGNYTNFRSPNGGLAAHDVWDYGLHNSEKKELLKTLKSLFSGKKVTETEKNTAITNLSRQALETLLGNPISIFHTIAR